jgi:spermidine synthase
LNDAQATPHGPQPARPRVTALFISVFVIATCGLVYELIAGALASYLLGDSVTQFSTVIGVYLFSMGVGSFLSRYVRKHLLSVFIRVEFLIGLVGGCSAALLFVCFEYVAWFRVVLYGTVMLTGILVGLEIPLLMRILRAHVAFTDLVSKVFTFDYIGALLASLLFPLVLVPYLGLVRSAFLFGILNALVGLWALHIFRAEIRALAALRAAGIGVVLALGIGFAWSDAIVGFAEAANYPGTVLYARSTPYQRIVITQDYEDLRLFLNGNLQFSSRDEYRYHESLVHPGLAAIKEPKHVLVLGGGDGLALREILKYPVVDSILLVDLDGEMTRLFSHNQRLAALNRHAFASPKVRVVNADAFLWIKNNQRLFNFIVIDFPDPGNYSIGKLYSTAFFKLVYGALAPGGLVVVQSTSPWVARKSYWCVNATLQQVGFNTTPYHAYVPAFGEWGFLLAHKETYRLPENFPQDLQFVNAETLQQMLQFPPDMGPVPVAVNRLNNQALVHYFEAEWQHYAH